MPKVTNEDLKLRIIYLEQELDNMREYIRELEEKMKNAAMQLNFEEAAKLRDEIKKLRQKMVGSNLA